jgi:hypothetical protein
VRLKTREGSRNQTAQNDVSSQRQKIKQAKCNKTNMNSFFQASPLQTKKIMQKFFKGKAGLESLIP